jgi:mannosylglucosylglycerate synthase
MKNTHNHLNIGFISFRFAGTDGVSLETAKWADVLEEMGHSCFYFSGQNDRPEAQAMVVPEAFFQHPEILAHHQRFFSGTTRTAADTKWIHHWREQFRTHITQFMREFNLDLLIPENLLTIPLHIPLALALTELIAETGIPTIAHHHDFAWERKRFLVNGVSDYLAAAFPPDLPSIQHVVINSQGQQQLALRRGIPSVIVPNVMNFEQPAPQMDAYAADLRDVLGIASDELFVLQPTRVIQRKGIEQAIELLQQLDRKSKLVISHESGDEGSEYATKVADYANSLGVDTVFCAEHFDEHRREGRNGRKIYSLWDAYPHADLVTYPSLLEGFGNAFLEAVYFRKPIVVNNYPVYATDINTKGFDVILFDDFITSDMVEKTNAVLDTPDQIAKMVEKNYALGLKYFSYGVLHEKLGWLIEKSF